MIYLDKRLLNFLVIILLSTVTFTWTFWIFHEILLPNVIITVIIVRLIASLLIFKDYSLSWSKSSQKTFFIKSAVYMTAFLIYMPIFYSELFIYFFISELFFYLFSINFITYTYYFYINKNTVLKTKSVIIYGAGKAGLKLEEEFQNGVYKVKYFVDDSKILHKRSIDGVRIISPKTLLKKVGSDKLDLLVIAMPSAPKSRIKEI